MALNGWTLPLTPSGTGQLVVPPPWHYSGDCLAVDYTVDPSAAAQFMPDGIVADADGSAALVIANWSARADGDFRQELDPKYSQYSEAFIVLFGTLQGRPVGRIPFIWVNNELSLIRGHVQGFPKTPAVVAVDRAVEVGRGGPRKEPGGVFHSYVSAHGTRLVTASVEIAEQVSDRVPRGASTPLVHTRLWPSMNGTGPVVNELTVADVAEKEFGRVFVGPATLTIEDGMFSEAGALAPLSVGQGWVYSMANTVLSSTTVVPG